MPIQSIAAKSELDSPFYLQNKDISEQWSRYFESIHAKVDGKYNAYGVWFRANLMIKNFEISLIFERQLQSVNSGLIPLRSPITERIDINIHSVKTMFIPIQILRPTLINRLKGLIRGLKSTTLRLGAKPRLMLFEKIDCYSIIEEIKKIDLIIFSFPYLNINVKDKNVLSIETIRSEHSPFDIPKFFEELISFISLLKK